VNAVTMVLLSSRSRVSGILTHNISGDMDM
jgi:hypothetical protein